ncbi:hypothetical protein AK812_SmicGene36258 [Symbiodinium microadriaticum]|uniref:Uncharacterized protein n=1 Tax=Symbiodinium microadriaticum TaxID=2951 RepID=A0A1Q9CJD1_SYMMI|nr:hypothetical protein AK812_SmicGene36258 [Symbiodinium microadriaticum]
MRAIRRAAEADTEAKVLPAVVTAADAAASTSEAAAPVKGAIAGTLGTGPVTCMKFGLYLVADSTFAAYEAPAPAKGKAKGSFEGAGKAIPVSTSAEGDKDETEDSSVESARRGDLNKVSTSAEGDKDRKEKSLLEAVRGGDLDKVKEFLANECDPYRLSNAWVSGQEKGCRWRNGNQAPHDSNGLTALSAAFCSPNCDIHMWFRLHNAADQPFKKPVQSSDAQADIRHDDERTLHKLQNTQADIREDQSRNQRSNAREGFREEEKRTLHLNAGVDIREDYFLRSLCDGKMNAITMADIRADKQRTLRMLVTLLRGEGQIFTDTVAGLLKEVEPGRYRSERLKERMRTVLCDYADDRLQVTKLFNGRGRHTATHFQFPSFVMCSHLAPDTEVQNFLEHGRRSDRRKTAFIRVVIPSHLKSEDVDAFNLSRHNMLYAAEVQVSLRSLPIAAPLACEPSVLAALAETANEDTLQTDAVEAITAAAWLQMRVATAVDNFLNCVALGCLCLVTWACRKEDMDAQPMHVDRVNGKEMKLLGDADVSFVQPAPSLETLFDFFFLVAGCFAIYGQMDMCSDGELEPIFLPGFCSMYWLRLMYSLRGERWLGPYLLPILSAVRDTGAFFFVTSLCVASATHAYVIMNPRGDDEYPIYSSFLHTVRLAIFGDFDLFEYQGQDTTFHSVEGEWAPNDPSPEDLGENTTSPYRPYIPYNPYIYLQLCFFGTGIGITVLLMLIAILSQNYEMQQGRAQGLFVQARARMLLEVQLRPWTRVGAWLGGKLFDPEVKGPPPLCLHLVTLAEIALRPLKVVMEPFVPGAYYQKNVFERFLQRALWSPVAKQNFLAVGIPVACVVLLAGSLVSLLAFAVIILVLKVVGFQLTGIRYTLNLSLFGLFGDRFAEECEIFALVRTDKMQKLEGKLKEQHEQQKAINLDECYGIGTVGMGTGENFSMQENYSNEISEMSAQNDRLQDELAGAERSFRMESEAKSGTGGPKAAPREQAVPPSPAPQPRATFSSLHEIPESLRYLFQSANIASASSVPPGSEGIPKNQSVPQNEKDNATGTPTAEPGQQSGIDATTLLQAAINMNTKPELEENKPKVKEAESIKFADYPNPETYRSWRTSVREVVRAASDRPDEPFKWAQEVYAKDATMETLYDTGEFLTLDTKLLAAVTQVAKAEISRQVLNFKETEASAGRPVRGRQVSWMSGFVDVHQHFKTNEEVGSLYSVEDLLKVTLVGDDLATFLYNFESVIAGMSHVPDEVTLRDIFLRQLRKSHSIKDDLQIFDRAKVFNAGTAKVELATPAEVWYLGKHVSVNHLQGLWLYWHNPKKNVPETSKFLSTGVEGIFLGYYVQPGFAFKKENLVAPVKDAPQPPAPKEPSSSSAELFDPTKNPDGTPVPAGAYESNMEHMHELYLDELEQTAEELFALVAKVMNQNDVAKVPEAQELMGKEWQELLYKGCWVENQVKEFVDVQKEVKQSGQKAHFGSLKSAA